MFAEEKAISSKGPLQSSETFAQILASDASAISILPPECRCVENTITVQVCA